jgi:hypothetical protein
MTGSTVLGTVSRCKERGQRLWPIKLPVIIDKNGNVTEYCRLILAGSGIIYNCAVYKNASLEDYDLRATSPGAETVLRMSGRF